VRKPHKLVLTPAQRAEAMKGMDMKGKDPGKKAEGTAHKGVGVVKKVDTAKSTVSASVTT